MVNHGYPWLTMDTIWYHMVPYGKPYGTIWPRDILFSYPAVGGEGHLFSYLFSYPRSHTPVPIPRSWWVPMWQIRINPGHVPIPGSHTRFPYPVPIPMLGYGNKWPSTPTAENVARPYGTNMVPYGTIMVPYPFRYHMVPHDTYRMVRYGTL